MFRPSVGDKMTVAVLKLLTRCEVEKSNLKWPDARASVARQAGLTPGALENLERGRLKFIDRVEAKLDELFLTTAERKIEAIRHEMALARARGETQPEIDVDAFEAAIAQARRALGHEA